MARYQQPPDPHETELSPQRERRLRADSREPIPWLWLGLGVLVTVLAIGAAVAFVGAMLAREPLDATLPTPTIIRLTAPPSVQPSPTTNLPTPSPIPTLTRAPTRDLSAPPPEITTGYYAVVTGTGEAGLTLRGGPGTLTVRVMRIAEGTEMLVLGGPEESDSDEFIWWNVRLLDGTEGWVAARFIVPAPAPDEAP